MTKKRQELPSIALSPGISTPVVDRVIGEPKHPYPKRIRLHPTTDAEDQRWLERQCKEAEVFWNIRMRNRP